MNYQEFIKDLDQRDKDALASGFKNVPDCIAIMGSKLFYRFVGLNGDGNKNDPYGCWWFSEITFNDFKKRANRLNISFTQFAKYRLALPDKWNSKLDIYELHLPSGATINGLVGTVHHQRDSYINENNKHVFYKNVFLIGGDAQYFFKKNDITKYHSQPISVF